MRRQREQKGRIYKENGSWFLRYYADRMIDGKVERRLIAKRLGKLATKGEAHDAAKPYLEEANSTARSQRPEGTMALVGFVDDVYFPDVTLRVRPSTLHGYRKLWNDVRDFCADLWLREVGVPEMQTVLNEIAATGRYNKTSMKHIKAFFSGVFKLAMQRGAYTKFNPMQPTSVPAARKPEDTYAYSLDEIDAMLAVLPDPAATVVATAAYTGARRGELRGMLWENYSGKEIRIEHSVWQSHITEPKSAKSKAPVPIIRPLAHRLDMLREIQGSPTYGPMFPNELGRPGDLNNLLNRVILPVLNQHGIEWHGWHAFRRGLATNLHRLGIDDKTIQAILRHANVATTQNVYIKTVSAATHEAMDRLDQHLALSSSKRAVKRSESDAEKVM